MLSFVLGLVNGTAEEVLWRGAYVTVFPSQPFFGWVYPSLGFALWHLAPQAIHPSAAPGGAVSFVLVSLLFGLCWGWVARQSHSIRRTTASHVLTDSLGLGGLVYLG